MKNKKLFNKIITSLLVIGLGVIFYFAAWWLMVIYALILSCLLIAWLFMRLGKDFDLIDLEVLLSAPESEENKKACMDALDRIDPNNLDMVKYERYKKARAWFEGKYRG